MDSLNMGLEVPFLGEGSRTKGTGVGLFACVLNHVGLQRPLLVKSFSTFTAFEGSFT
jgi:hypothetical protein